MKNKKRSKSKKDKSFPVYYLVIALSAIILLEGFLIGVASPVDWEKSMHILDISQDVDVVMSDMYYTFEPMIEQIDNVTAFYHQSADATIALLDASEHDPMLVFDGVNEFYRLASLAMEDMLDLSDDLSYIPRVAGAAFSR
jgi:hypothetical protein